MFIFQKSDLFYYKNRKITEYSPLKRFYYEFSTIQMKNFPLVCWFNVILKQMAEKHDFQEVLRQK